jgi:hypothetical protein
LRKTVSRPKIAAGNNLTVVGSTEINPPSFDAALPVGIGGHNFNRSAFLTRSRAGHQHLHGNAIARVIEFATSKPTERPRQRNRGNGDHDADHNQDLDQRESAVSQQ